ncbi:MAG: SoxR reducing system RseC family protein [Tepidanaerobacteraceae bacterium]|nr:SoxR reducing system RseC family protein [Tepidanaerobacteraceae bacterium]
MREKAIVVSHNNDRAQVEIMRTTACDGCRGCSVGKQGTPLRVWVNNPINAKIGQSVEIELEATTLLSATFIAYGIPLLAFLAGIGMGYKVSGYFNITAVEPFAFITGIGAMLVSYLSIHFFNTKDETINKYTSRIVNIF